MMMSVCVYKSGPECKFEFLGRALGHEASSAGAGVAQSFQAHMEPGTTPLRNNCSLYYSTRLGAPCQFGADTVKTGDPKPTQTQTPPKSRPK